MKEPKDLTILLVDDEDDLREAVSMDFQMRGYNVLEANNGRTAFELLKANKVHLVVSDVRMPGGDGIELLDKTMELDPGIPAVALVTGFADITTEDAYEKGASIILSKPFDRKILMATVVRLTATRLESWSGQLPMTLTDANAARPPFQLELELDTAEAGPGPGKFRLGRGGFFAGISGPYPQPDTLVEFKLRFKGGPIPLIEGVGISRWNRNKPMPDSSLGTGVEFQTLADSCRQTVCDWIEGKRPKPFIPKT